MKIRFVWIVFAIFGTGPAWAQRWDLEGTLALYGGAKALPVSSVAVFGLQNLPEERVDGLIRQVHA